MPGRQGRVLLIGNSRWHWAETDNGCGDRHHGLERSGVTVPMAGASPFAGAASRGGPAPEEGPVPEEGAAVRTLAGWEIRDGPPPRPGDWAADEILAWAAVGPVSKEQAAHLPAERRLVTAQVPLGATPPWLGVDRALVGWQAWRRQQAIEPAPVLVADAGTVLSLTLVGGDGCFQGGRLLAGAALQWRAMAAGTAHLPSLAGLDADPSSGRSSEPLTAWPRSTEAAMEVGVLQGLAAAVAQAHGQLLGGLQAGEGPRLWLCGGDGPRLAPLLRASGLVVQEAPNLAIEALIALAPLSPDRGR